MDDAKYTDPALRHRLKDEIQAGDRGGRPGQWSARKAQLLVTEYEKAGGGYAEGGKDDSQKHLEQWGHQEWHATGPGGRYLPDVAWELLSPAERKATDRKKGGAAQQFVANTEAAKEARKAAELLSMRAADAVKAVRSMGTASQLDRARAAEADHGKGRKTVLAAIDERGAALA